MMAYGGEEYSSIGRPKTRWVDDVRKDIQEVKSTKLEDSCPR
jgi:hypothetical protein